MTGFFEDANASGASGRTRASAKRGRGSNRRAAFLRRHIVRCLTATQKASLSYLKPNSYVSLSHDPIFVAVLTCRMLLPGFKSPAEAAEAVAQVGRRRKKKRTELGFLSVCT